jgi:hypothetical protein
MACERRQAALSREVIRHTINLLCEGQISLAAINAHNHTFGDTQFAEIKKFVSACVFSSFTQLVGDLNGRTYV